MVTFVIEFLTRLEVRRLVKPLFKIIRCVWKQLEKTLGRIIRAQQLAIYLRRYIPPTKADKFDVLSILMASCSAWQRLCSGVRLRHVHRLCQLSPGSVPTSTILSIIFVKHDDDRDTMCDMIYKAFLARASCIGVFVVQ